LLTLPERSLETDQQRPIDRAGVHGQREQVNAAGQHDRAALLAGGQVVVGQPPGVGDDEVSRPGGNQHPFAGANGRWRVQRDGVRDLAYVAVEDGKLVQLG
jgi:hypothetical protein